jgi:hypothetical protein
VGAAGGAELRVALFCCAAEKFDFDGAGVVIPGCGAALDDGEWEAFVALETWLDWDEEVILLDEPESDESAWCADVPIDVCRWRDEY